MAIVARASALLVEALRPVISAMCTGDRTIAIPAGALSFAHDGDFVGVMNGIDWGASAGSMTATVPRPRDHAGGPVTVRFFFMFRSDEAGSHQFTVTPMTYDSGNNFETYGALATPSMSAPESLGSVYALSVTIEPGDGWGDGDFWYFRFTRQGSFSGAIRIMSVGVDYRARL